MLLCVERLERNTREKERACIELLFSYCMLIVVAIKQCVLSPLSVSKPPPVVSPPTIINRNGRRYVVL
jgi:hypothetical protein